MNTINLNQFPAETQEEIKETLSCFVGCSVTRENGEYTVVAASCLSDSVKAKDFKVWNFKNTDIYTNAEINEFNKALPELF